MALKLKLKIGGGSDGSTPSTPAPEVSSPGLPKIKIKPPKPIRVVKPTEKDKDKRIKLKLSNKKSRKTAAETIPKPANIPRVRVKPTRVPGEGYDSEAPDLEDDPLLEQAIVLRFLNDTNLDFVHNAVDSGDFAGLNIKWVSRDKAVVNVNGTLYSARLVDLPTVTEIFKTIDKKNIFKTFDVCQMLLVLRKIDPTEFNLEKDFEVDDAKYYHHPLFKYSINQELKEKTLVYRDGLTTPFEDVYRRFRPRKVNHRIMDLVDAKVNQMIKADDEAEEFTFDIVDLRKQTPKYGGTSNTPSAAGTPVPRSDGPEFSHHQQQEPMDEGYDEEMNLGDDIEIDLEDELNKALDGEDSMPLGEMNILGTMMAEAEEQAEEAEAEQEEEEEEEDDDEDDAEEEEEEEEEEEDRGLKTGKQHMRLLEEEIAELETAAEHNKKNLTTATSRMMRLKFQTAYNNLKSSLDAKKNSLAKLKEEQSHTQRISDPTRSNTDLTAQTEPQDGDEEEQDIDDDQNQGDDDEGQGDDLDDLFL